MRTRNSGFVLVVMMLVASVLFMAPAAGTGGESGNPCDSEYVQIHEWPYMVTVLPNGVDDTDNLQCALDYGAARDWAKIMLVAGDYYTNFLEAEDFAGVFMGAGREHTRLLTLPDGPGGLDCAARFDEAGDTALLTFAASDVMVKGLTFGIGGEKACAVPNPFEEESVIGLFATTRLRADETCPPDVEHRFRVYGIGVESEFQPGESITGFRSGDLGWTARPRPGSGMRNQTSWSSPSEEFAFLRSAFCDVRRRHRGLEHHDRWMGTLAWQHD